MPVTRIQGRRIPPADVPTKEDLHVCRITCFHTQEDRIIPNRDKRGQKNPSTSRKTKSPTSPDRNFHSSNRTNPETQRNSLPIPVLKFGYEFFAPFPCEPGPIVPTIATRTLLQEVIAFMRSLFVAGSESLSVLIADSNRMQVQLLSSALRRRPEFHIATCQMDADSILQSVAGKPPQVAILSPSSPANVAEIVGTLRGFHLSHPIIPKVLLLESWDRELVVSAFRSGARGIFNITESNLHLLCKCLVRVAGGQVWINTEQTNYLLDLISEVPSLRVVNTGGRPILTPREEQVVALVAEGFSNREIARELNLSHHTIKKYLFRIFEKLGISTRVELVLYAVNNGDPRPAAWLIGSGHMPHKGN
jgi:DNA-binding NarL/FixJ family response regulator